MMIWLCTASQKVAETSSRRRSRHGSGEWLYVLPGIQHSESSHCALKCNYIFPPQKQNQKKELHVSPLGASAEQRWQLTEEEKKSLNPQSPTTCHAVRSYHKKEMSPLVSILVCLSVSTLGELTSTSTRAQSQLWQDKLLGRISTVSVSKPPRSWQAMTYLAKTLLKGLCHCVCHAPLTHDDVLNYIFQSCV